MGAVLSVKLEAAFASLQCSSELTPDLLAELTPVQRHGAQPVTSMPEALIDGKEETLQDLPTMVPAASAGRGPTEGLRRG